MGSLTLEPTLEASVEVSPVVESEPLATHAVVAQPVVEVEPMATPVLLLQPEDVVAWLRGLHPEALCGTGGSMGRCPLARYLLARNGPHYGAVEVDSYFYRLFRAGRCTTADTPYWAMHFISRVDGEYAGRPVSARAALALLDQALWVAGYFRKARRPGPGQSPTLACHQAGPAL